MLLCFVIALLASPWGLVVRVRELAWLNALINIAQVGFAAIADLWLIQTFGLWGAVGAVALTTLLTVGFSFAAWWLADRGSLSVPWKYGLRCLLAASPYLLLFPLSLVPLGRRALVIVMLPTAAILTVAWLALLKKLRLLDRGEVPLLHESRHGPLRWALARLSG
jgi:hypothetical protein